MARFIAISGPSSTGKTTIAQRLSQSESLRGKVICSPDIFEDVWINFVKQAGFSESKEIISDSIYLGTYCVKLLEHYESLLDRYSLTDKLIILDGSWIDFLVYGMVNMWYSNMMSEIQEHYFSRLSNYVNKMSRIYITEYNPYIKSVPFHRTMRSSNLKANRNLELSYYKLFSHMNNTLQIDTSDVDTAVSLIIDDLRKLGYD